MKANSQPRRVDVMGRQDERRLSILTVAIIATGLAVLLAAGELMESQSSQVEATNQNRGQTVSPPR